MHRAPITDRVSRGNVKQPWWRPSVRPSVCPSVRPFVSILSFELIDLLTQVFLKVYESLMTVARSRVNVRLEY